jgi:dolichyl-phosphate-mannose--protein O-mannosyl transferase
VVAIVAGGLASARLFRSRQAGVLAAALLASDGFTIAYSRAALLDGPLAMCLALALLLATLRPRLMTALVGGLLLGVASSLKFSGVGVALPLVTALVLAEPRWTRRLGLSLVAALAAAGVYFGTYSLGLSLAGQPTGLSAVLADTARLLEHHAALTDMKNPWVSGWSTWWLPLRAWPLAYQPGPDGLRVLSMLGNLATWWSAVGVGLAATIVVFVRGLRTIGAEPTADAEALARHGRAVLVLLSGALGFLAPWVLSHRDSYLYHFLPSYLALVLVLSGAVTELRARRPAWALTWLVVVVTVAALYEPLWCFSPMSPESVDWRLFWRGWR